MNEVPSVQKTNPQTPGLSINLDSLEGWRDASKYLYFFETRVLSTAWEDKFQNFGSLQRLLCNYLQNYQGEKLLVSIFRGSYKSTVTLGFCIWLFCWSVQNGEAMSICYNTSSKENASIFMEDFRQTLLNSKKLHQIFPALPKEPSAYLKWTIRMIEAGQVKFHVASLETRQVMRHYQVIINDDLVNDENAFSEVERANISRKWKLQKSILTKYRKFKVGTEIDIGTPYHHKDLMSHLMKNVNTYRKFIIPYALPDENGTLDLDRGIGILTMPEMFCWEDFQEKRQEMGPSLFGTQYELKVVDDLDRICEEKWLRYWAVLPKNYQRIFVIDPSGVGDKEDPGTGVFGCDIDPAGYVYVIYAEEVSTTPYQLIKLLEQIRSQYDPDEIYMEKEKYSDTIADTLQHLESKLFFSFVEHKGRTKGYRIGRIKQFMETGRVLLGRGQRTLEDRLLNHPDCPKHLLDAMAYALEKMNPPKRNIERDRNSSSEDDFEEELKRAFVYRQEAEVMENDSIF